MLKQKNKSWEWYDIMMILKWILIGEFEPFI